VRMKRGRFLSRSKTLRGQALSARSRLAVVKAEGVALGYHHEAAVQKNTVREKGKKIRDDQPKDEVIKKKTHRGCRKL